MSTTPSLNLLLDDLEDASQSDDALALFDAFSNWADAAGTPLYPHQAEAAMEIMVGDNHVIAATPTGSGKSLIAVAGHLAALARGGRTYYTAPIKALVSEKFFDLVDLFGSANVGMVTGDVSINADAPIICCTAEILANQALREGAELDVDVVVVDEFHYYGDPERGWAWQAPLLELPQAQFVLLSATLGDVSFIASDLEKRTGRGVTVLRNATRPVPLEFNYAIESIGDLVERLIGQERVPAYIVHPSQRGAISTATSLPRTLISKDQAARIVDFIGDFRFGTGFGKTLSSLLRVGIGVHHAGMLPRYRRLVERLARAGLLPVICGTDTLGVGINVPIRCVVFTSLVKFDGVQQRHMNAREFHQIAGRAGRAGFDKVGYVEVQAPEHVIENAKALAKAGDDEKKRRKIVRKKAPEGQVNWTDKTYERLLSAEPERLEPQWQITHSMVLSVIARGEGNAAALERLATDNHNMLCAGADAENPFAAALADVLASLEQAEIIKPGANGDWELARDLPDSMALNTPLSPFAWGAIEALVTGELQPAEGALTAAEGSPEAELTAALDVISFVEAITEDPRPILFAQRDHARQALYGRLREEKVSFEERQRLLDEVTWPQPLAEEIRAMYSVYLLSNPWAKAYEPSPKSIVREMIEGAITFTEMISRYDLPRSEGTLLRYLTDVYRNLRQVVPLAAQTETFTEIVEWLGKLVRSVDSSLLDEWERLESLAAGESAGADADDAPGETPAAELAFGVDADGRVDFRRNPAALLASWRRSIYQILDALAVDNPDRAAEADQATRERLEGPAASVFPEFSADDFDRALGDFWNEYEWMDTTAAGRAAENLRIITDPSPADWVAAGVAEAAAVEIPEDEWWLAELVIVDDADDLSWRLHCAAHLPSSQACGEAAGAVISLRPES